MKNVDKDLGLTWRSKLLLCVCVLSLIAAILLMFREMDDRTTASLEETIKKRILGASETAAIAVNRELSGRQLLVQSLAYDIEVSELSSVDEMLKQLQIYCKYYDFFDMSIADANGNCKTVAGREFNIASQDYFQRGMMGESAITQSITSLVQPDINVNIFSAPIYFDGEVKYVLTAAYPSDNLTEILNVKFYGDSGQNFIINSKGESVINLKGDYPEYQAFSGFVTQHSFLIPSDDFEQNYVLFHYQDEEYFSYMTKIGIEDWYLLSYVSRTDAFASVHEIQHNMFLMMFISFVIILFFLSIIVILFVRHQKKIRTMIFMDEMLRKPNYTYLRLHFKHLPAAQRENSSIIVFDIDKFKEINLSHGSKAGNVLLRYIAKVFEQEAPQLDLFRNLADQFVALAMHETNAEISEDIERVLKRINTDLARGSVVPFTLSFGICNSAGYHSLNPIHTNAMIAQNTVKGNPLVRYAFFDEQLRKTSLHNSEIKSSFFAALRNHEFHIYYQPKFDMRTHKIIGSEALVRWIKPDGTLISPGNFIPCFERTGQILKLDEAILDMVCHQMYQMQVEGIDVPCVSVNLSRFHLAKPHIIGKIENYIETLGLDPSKLAFEITESAMQDDKIVLSDIVHRLHQLGCRVDMDDYGTGISSLQSLANTDFDVIKLDQSFIRNIGQPKMEHVIQSTIGLANMLDLQLVAEGVETQEQVDFLVKNGCYYAQGYFFSKPIPYQDYSAMVKQQSN